MTSQGIYPLARMLYVLFPDPRISGMVRDAETQYAVSEGLIEA